MLNDAFKHYEELYSQLITSFAELHNKHLSFVKEKGRDTGFAVRKHTREIEDLAKQLKRQSQLVSKESLANRRLAKQQAREEKKNKKKPRNDMVP